MSALQLAGPKRYRTRPHGATERGTPNGDVLEEFVELGRELDEERRADPHKGLREV